ncbi:MAG: hypothetical protein C5B54_00870 [Acidobacteria bacterium]|nr:MAG: hypothetical protein C5B54_00870 [Acidobacteriota bacterium]
MLDSAPLMLVERANLRQKLLLSVITIVVGIIAMEITGRLTGFLPAPPSAEYVALSKEVGPLNKPLRRWYNEIPDGYTIWSQANRMGYLDTPTDFPNTNQKKILILGDSYAVGCQVTIQYRWATQLSQFHQDWAILNLANPNWATDQECLTLLHYPLRYQPDTVLLCFNPGNDVSDNARLLLTGVAPNRPYFVPATNNFDQAPIPLKKIGWRYTDEYDYPSERRFPDNTRIWLYLHSAVYRAAGDCVRALRQPATPAHQAVGSSEPHTEWGVFALSQKPEWNVAWKITETLILKMKTESEARGAIFKIIVIPYYGAADPKLTPEFFKTNSADYDLMKPNRHLADFAQKNDIALFDLTPGFLEYQKATGASLFLRKDKHFTVTGNCVAAVLINHWLDPSTQVSLDRCH